MLADPKLDLQSISGATLGSRAMSRQVYGLRPSVTEGLGYRLCGHWGYLGATPANEQIIGIQALGLLGLPWGYLCQRANHWNTSSGATGATLGLPLLTSKSLEYRFRGYWGYLGATLANEQIIGIQALGLLGLPWGYLCQQANHWNAGSGVTGPILGLPSPTSKSLEYRLWGYRGYLKATFANGQIVGMQALGLLGLPWGYLCQRANHWNTGSAATGATLALPLPTSKSLEYRLWGY